MENGGGLKNNSEMRNLPMCSFWVAIIVGAAIGLSSRGIGRPMTFYGGMGIFAGVLAVVLAIALMWLGRRALLELVAYQGWKVPGIPLVRATASTALIVFAICVAAYALQSSPAVVPLLSRHDASIQVLAALAALCVGALTAFESSDGQAAGNRVLGNWSETLDHDL